MTEINPQYIDGLSYEAKRDRQPFRDVLTEGILNNYPDSGNFLVSQHNTPNMSVGVGSGIAYVQNDEGLAGGHYRIYNDATVTKTIAASDPSNPRIDRIIAQIYDATDIGGAVNSWAIEVLTGTPAASPTAPALPSNALNLALVAVAANTTSIVNANITSQAVRTYINSNLLLQASIALVTPIINTSISGTAIATGAEVTTGSANDKIVTPKSIGDALVNTRLKSKTIEFTRGIGDANGDVSYTGIGFPPTSLIFNAYFLTASISFAAIDSSGAAKGTYSVPAAWGNVNLTTSGTNVCIYGQSSLNNYQVAKWKSYDADGFTLSWYKTNYPTGGYIIVECIAYR